MNRISSIVTSLFAAASGNGLIPLVTSYWLNQAVMKVDELSSPLFSKEKLALRKLEKKAKQLMAERKIPVNGISNLIRDGYMVR